MGHEEVQFWKATCVAFETTKSVMSRRTDESECVASCQDELSSMELIWFAAGAVCGTKINLHEAVAADATERFAQTWPGILYRSRCRM
jgi:hypothetical protein